MANLVENKEWIEAIYQIEETDDVIGGANGVSNTQAKQLANRTLWLKDKTEQIDVVNAALDNRLDSVEAEVSNARDGQASLFNRIAKAKVKTGTVTIYNRYIIRGCDVVHPSAGEYRDIIITDIGCFGNYAIINGQVYNFPETTFIIPVNNTGDIVNWYFYAYLDVNGNPTLGMGNSLPETAVPIGYYESPDNDSDDLQGFYNEMTGEWYSRFTDQRKYTEIEGWYASYYGEAYVTIPDDIASTTNYTVQIEVLSASPIWQVGDVRISERTINGFKINVTGLADNIQLRWTVIPVLP
jgi:hypothetical protein